jgi:hypothetical protein
VPSSAKPDGLGTPLPGNVKTEVNLAQTYVSTIGTPLRSRTPTATDLATIPSEHVPPQSAPTPAPGSTPYRVQALAVLKKMMGKRLSPDALANYEVVISNLVRRGAKETAIRKRYHPALIDFLSDHPQAVPVHNKFANVYNRQFEGQHERFHLPLYGDVGVMRDVKKEELAESEGPAYVIERSAGYDMCLGTATTSGEAFLWQLDGTTDGAPCDFAQQDPARVSIWPSVGHGSPTVHTAEDENNSIERQTPIEQDRETRDLEAPVLIQDTHVNETVQHQDQGRAGSATEETRIRDVPTAVAAADSAPASPKDARSGVEPYGPALPVAVVSQEDATQAVDVMMIDNETENETRIEGGIGDKEGSDSSSAQQDTPASTNPSSPVSRPSHFAKRESARSYLAWLHHRQTRFPTVAPNYSECMLLAQKLGKHPAKIFDEALYHWGFENGNEWYRENRLAVLGEDPRFDSDGMGRWDAWLQQGRGQLKRKRRWK